MARLASRGEKWPRAAYSSPATLSKMAPSQLQNLHPGFDSRRRLQQLRCSGRFTPSVGMPTGPILASVADISPPRCLLLRCKDEVRDGGGGLFLHRRDGVRVGVEGNRDGGMPEALGDHLRVDAGAQGEGGMGVA